MRPLVIDLRDAGRLDGAAVQAAAPLFAELERRGLRISTIVGPDLVLAARVQRVISFHAPTCGGCFLTEDEGVDWVRSGPPPVPAPLGPREGGLRIAPPRV